MMLQEGVCSLSAEAVQQSACFQLMLPSHSTPRCSYYRLLCSQQECAYCYGWELASMMPLRCACCFMAVGFSCSDTKLYCIRTYSLPALHMLWASHMHTACRFGLLCILGSRCALLRHQQPCGGA